jgi:hypothetical protein
VLQRNIPVIELVILMTYVVWWQHLPQFGCGSISDVSVPVTFSFAYYVCWHHTLTSHLQKLCVRII